MKYFYNNAIIDLDLLPEHGYKMSSDINEIDALVELNQQQLDFLELHPKANFTEVINLQTSPPLTKEELFDTVKCIADIRSSLDMIKYAPYSFLIFDAIVKKNFFLCNKIVVDLNAIGVATIQEVAIYKNIFSLQNINISEY